MKSIISWEQYSAARDQLQARLADKIRRQMCTLIGDMASADLLLVAADGKKLAAHECILRSRAPGFYQRHVEATVSAMGPRQAGKLREVAIGDIDSTGLEFFIHSVYTEEEIARIPVGESDDRQEASSSASNQSFIMDESTTELDFQMSGAEDDRVDDNTPTFKAGRLPHAQFSNPSGVLSNPNSPRKMPLQCSMSSSAGPYPMTGTSANVFNTISTSSAPSMPIMTSFRDLATGSPMNSSIYSLGGRSEVADIPEEDEGDNGTDNQEGSRDAVNIDNRPMSKFIRLDSLSNGNDIPKQQLERKRSSGGNRQMFPMFIGLTDNLENFDNSEMRSNRLGLSKRMSMTSLTSLTSIDITPSNEGQPPIGDMTACSKLAADLMKMYVNSEDTDCFIRTEDGDIHAHKCILSATCPFFRQQLTKSKRVEMRGFSKNSINFLLMYLYGGVTSIPPDVDVWEIVSLATHLNHKDLVQVVILHLKATKCHWFHRPCSSCVSAVFDCLPQLASIRCLRPLYDEAMAWQAKNFSRVWKGRVFLYLNERLQKECYEAVVNYLNDETIIDVILNSERLQIALSRSKSELAGNVLQMVDDVVDVAMQFLVQSFHLVVTSKSFQQQGKGLALNLGLLEDLLPSVIHSLSADSAIKTYKGLFLLMNEIQQTPPSPKRTMNIPVDEWSPRFLALIRRMIELTDRHLLHYAASVVRADAYNLLNNEQKRRIEECGIFVEMRQPTAPPPRLSSTTRTYKRSASVGVQNIATNSNQRARSAERLPKPLENVKKEGEHSNLNSGDTEIIRTIKNNDDEDKHPKQYNQEDVNSETDKIKEKEIITKIESPVRRSRSQNSEQSQERENVEKSEKNQETVNRNPKKIVSKSIEASKGRDMTRRSPIKKKSVNSVPQKFEMERESTHTILNVDKARAVNLPGPDSSPVKNSGEKPKSVVKPMVKDSPLASSANRTVIRDRLSSRKTGEQIKSPAQTAAKSSIPKPASSRMSSGTTTQTRQSVTKPTKSQASKRSSSRKDVPKK